MENSKDNFFDEELALSEMLKEGILFCNCCYYSLQKDGKSEGETVVLFVNLNDIFCPAADALELLTTEIEDLYSLYSQYKYLQNKYYGVIKWAALKLGLKPMYAYQKEMKEQGLWDDKLEKLRDNKF